MTKHTVIVDGATIEVGSADDVKKVTAWLDQIANDNKQLADKTIAHNALMATKDEEISGKKAEISRLQQQDRDTRELVIALGDLKVKCKERLGVDAVGRTVVDMKRDALRKKIGAANVEGKDNSYIEARFDMVLDSSAMSLPDPFRDALKSGLAPVSGTAEAADRAYHDMCEDLRTAHLRRDN